MKICWDVLDKLEYTQSGFKKKNCTNRNYYVESEKGCLNCGETFLIDKRQTSKFCSKKCSQSGKFHNYYGKKRPNHAKKMTENNPMYYTDMTGENNPNWKGGISKRKYCSGWSHLSKEIREHYNGCQNPHCCGTSNKLTTHHVDYNKQNCHPDNLIVLCNICNGEANGNREWHFNFYKELKENEQSCSAKRRLHIFKYSRLEKSSMSYDKRQDRSSEIC